MSPLRRQNPSGEPDALAAHAGYCAGGGWQQQSPCTLQAAHQNTLLSTRGRTVSLWRQHDAKNVTQQYLALLRLIFR
jgi:membrane-bound lytic murein transglycosylase B